MKPKPGVIDLEAQEIERGPAEPQPAPEDAAETAPQDEPAPAEEAALFEAEPRSQLGSLIAAGLAGAVIAILAFLLLLTTDTIRLGGGGDPALGSRIAALEAQLQKVSAAPAAAPAPADDTAVRDQIAALSRQIDELRAAPAPSASGDTPDTALAARVDKLASRVDTLSEAVEQRATSAAFSQLTARLDQIAEQATEARAPDASVQSALAGARSAAALAAVSSLDSAVARGVPYPAALGAVRTQMPDADLSALEAGASKGLPSAKLLAERLAASLEKAPGPASTATSLVDRLAEGARGLVRVRPLDGSVPEANDPWSVRSAVATRLGQGDYAGALADWDKLDAAAKQATSADADALRARLGADSALDALRASALDLASEARP